MFGNIAPRYDLLNHLLSLNIDRYWRWRTTQLCPPRGDGPILDVCTGTGDLALAYDRAARQAVGHHRQRFLSAHAGARAPQGGPETCLRPGPLRRGRYPAAALSRRHVSDHLRGVWPAQCHQHRSRPGRDGAGDPARRPRGHPRIFSAAQLVVWRHLSLLFQVGSAHDWPAAIPRARTRPTTICRPA